MRLSAFLFLIVAVYSTAGAQTINSSLSNELTAMLTVDQEARMKCSNGTGDEQMQCLAKIFETIDKPNTKRLEEIFNTFGFPGVRLVGKNGFTAFMVLLQHSASDSL